MNTYYPFKPKIKLYAKTLHPLLLWLKDNPDDKDIKYTVARLLRYYSNTHKSNRIPLDVL